MLSLREANRWVAPLLAALVMAGAAIPAVYAAPPNMPSAVPSCDKTFGRPADRPPPPGQLKRRGVVGEIVAVDPESGTITIGTKFGGVEIVVPEDFSVSEDLVGSRAAVLTAKAPKPADGGEDGAGTEEGAADEGASEEESASAPIRTASALKIRIIPTVSTITHEQAVVVGTAEDSLEVADEDGDVSEVEVADAGDTGGEEVAGGGDDADIVEEGEDVVLLTECAGPGATPKVRALRKAAKVTQRLERMRARIEERFGDDPAKLARFESLIQKRQEKLEARLERVANRAPSKFKTRAEKALGKARGECPNDGECPEDREGGPPADRGSGKPDDKGNKKRGDGKDGDKGKGGDRRGSERGGKGGGKN